MAHGGAETVQITMLNSMTGGEFEPALDRHVAWGIGVLDLKDAIFGKGIADLTDAEADTAARMIQVRGLSVYCLSTGLFFDDVEKGEAVFRRDHLAKLDHVLALADTLRPTFIRLLAARTTRRRQIDDSFRYLQSEHPWVVDVYGEAVDRIAASGFRATIENEVGGCIFAHPQEIRAFFEKLGRRRTCCLTWDVQNLWQEGTFPSLDVYAQLKDLIGYYHLKGGQSEEPGGALKWRSPLVTASWPVPEEAPIDFTQQDLDDARRIVREAAE
jgi:hypothetical protein